MKIFGKSNKPVESNIEEKHLIVEEKKEYNLELGKVNRYENALVQNKELAKKINQEAQFLVNKASKVLDLLEDDPKKSHFPSLQGGGEWNSIYIQRVLTDLSKLYGTNSESFSLFDDDKGIPHEVISFVRRVKKFNKRISNNPDIIFNY